jgi:hypothetical protein
VLQNNPGRKFRVFEQGMFMPIVDYTPKLFGDVSEMVSQFPGPINLAHRPFVDYYYATRESSKLYLYYSDSGKVIGTLGRELTRFEYNSRELTIPIGTPCSREWEASFPGIPRNPTPTAPGLCSPRARILSPSSVTTTGLSCRGFAAIS